MKNLIKYLVFPLLVSSFLFGADLKGYIVSVVFCFPIVFLSEKILEDC